MPSTISADERSASVSSMRRTNDAAVAPREQPVEERRAGAADVQVAGGRRREADARIIGDGDREVDVRGTRAGGRPSGVGQSLAQAAGDDPKLAVRQGFEPWVQL